METTVADGPGPTIDNDVSKPEIAFILGNIQVLSYPTIQETKSNPKKNIQAALVQGKEPNAPG